ncbi:N12 class adenine-specific DNA methylase [Lachnospiraceae bacterium PF1-21]
MKIQTVETLLKGCSYKIMENRENWLSFLDTASNLYKYPIEEQILIYAQRPGASACAPIKIWSDYQHCWVKKGAKGIALIDDNHRLKYVFDVADVYPLEGIGVLPKAWTVYQEIKGAICEYLEQKYKAVLSTQTLEEQLLLIARKYAKEKIAMFPLYEDMNIFNEDEIKSCEDFISQSIAYQLYRNCGCDVIGLKAKYDYDVTVLKDVSALKIIGDTINQSSKEILVDLARKVRELELVMPAPTKEEKERVNTNESTISEDRRLLHSQLDAVQGTTKEVWTDEVEISEGTKEHIVRKDVFGRESNRTPDEHSNASGEERSISYSENGKSREHKRDIEETRTYEVGAKNEQHTDASRGNGSSGADFQLANNLPEYLLESVLKNNSFMNSSKLDIIECFSEVQDIQKRSAYVRKAFNTNNAYNTILFAGQNITFRTSDEGIIMWEGTPLTGKARGSYTWGQVTDKIQEYIINNDYLSDSEKEALISDDIIFRSDKISNDIIDVSGEEYSQLSLFPSMGEQIGNIMIDKANDALIVKSVATIEDKIINDILLTGGGEKGSRYDIYNFFVRQSENDLSVFAEFLENEYGTGGKGFNIDNVDYCQWYDESGIKINQGDSARSSWQVSLSWEEVAKKVSRLIQEGEFLSAADVSSSHQKEVNDLANKIYYFYRDNDIDWPEMLNEKNGYPDIIAILEREIQSGEGIEELQVDVSKYREGLQTGLYSNEMFTKRYHPTNVSHDIEYYLKETKVYSPRKREFPILQESFITSDLLDLVLLSGSGMSEGKYRIYEAFRENPDSKTRIAFLKAEYGVGGRSHAVHRHDNISEMHDGKGIELSMRVSNDEERTKVLFKWNTISKRISFLIEHDFYLTQEEITQYVEKRMDADVLSSTNINKDEQTERVSNSPLLTEQSIEHKNYIALRDIAKEVLEGSKDYMRFTAGKSFMPLTVERIGGGFIAMSHYFLQNGDMMADPDMEFLVDKENEKLIAFTYQQDAMNIFQDAGRHSGDIDYELQKQLNEFASEWIRNIKNQGYKLEAPERKQEKDVTFEESENDSEIKKEGTHENFRIRDYDLGMGKNSDKFRANINAINLLKKLEKEGRSATPEEQIRLADYVGWGGLSQSFEEVRPQNAELKNYLTEEEYVAARESTLSAFYTQPFIIEEMYKALERMGVKKGNLLEPAMGTGNFFGKLPESLREMKLYGVELDSISGRIAKQLYPNANIKVSGFEETNFPDAFFDVVIGNVPFGNFKISDKKYDKYNFLIHDYFFAKALDQVRPGGVVAFITSKGTMDKENPSVRRYIAQRADLMGAIRLPNNAFKDNAGTEVTSDILFLKKRERIIDVEPDWVYVGSGNDGITMNQYFVNNPKMIVGEMQEVSGQFGKEMACVLDNQGDFRNGLQEAFNYITGKIEVYERTEDPSAHEEAVIADPNIRNYSYTNLEGMVYYKEGNAMIPYEGSEIAKERIKGLIEIRDITRRLIERQLQEYSDENISLTQDKLHQAYDKFTKKYGLINSQGNKRAFENDASYYLLCSLEELNEDGSLKNKAPMFYKRTIKPQEIITHVGTSPEALAVSLQEKARVDLDYMSSLTGKEVDDVIKDLHGIIFKNPLTSKWETADEYLSGNVREKLKVAESFADSEESFRANVEGLKKVQPKKLQAAEIDVRIGATWISPAFITDFIRDIFQPSFFLLDRGYIDVYYSHATGQWNVKGKTSDSNNVMANTTYGTKRANGYRILEDSLNLRDTRIFDTEYEDGKEKRVLNKKETMLASQKQDALKEAFREWLFKDKDRRDILVEKYNELFNSKRPRVYNGEHLVFPSMNPEIELKDHQKNGIARILYGDNSLLAHCVGAGKTYTMIAAAMEGKRLGLSNKPMFVVPNHLIEQWANEFMLLYPGANILASTKKDFQPANRKKFCSRIATGEYDAVIIGHSQFEKIPLSTERQIEIIERQIHEITIEIDGIKRENGERFTIKQMEKLKKTLKVRLTKLNDTERKDNVIDFESLGIDRLYVDESHGYKNLFLYTKMRNVAGISQTEAQKSSDMYAKCQYIDELTGGKGITFASGTPISNSMTELYTNMRYLQGHTLSEMRLGHFDAWASSFGETNTAIELAPEGTGYRAKTRFSKFYNLPELMNIFQEVADIQTADMLKLPVPEVEYIDVALKPSEDQVEMVHNLAERAEIVRNNGVDASEDNMLKITNDGRKLALDQRLINELLPVSENCKSIKCVEKAYQLWESTKADKSAQLIFSDLSTPRPGTYNVYDDIKKQLIIKGVPENEIAFIHDANTDKRKADLFSKVRRGEVRFLLGSTAKMGAGTNVQDRLIALHHLDVPWRPSDIEQREGRIIRQGNVNEKVKIYRYITEGTFDAYSWQLIENKQKFIGQIMTSKSPVRSAEDIDEAALSYAEVKALATGNPHIKEKMDLDIQVAKLKLLKANYKNQIYQLEDDIAKNYPMKIAICKERMAGYKKDIILYEENKPIDDAFSIELAGKVFNDKKAGANALILAMKSMSKPTEEVVIGHYAGFEMKTKWSGWSNSYDVLLCGALPHTVEMSLSEHGNLVRMNNVLESLNSKSEQYQIKLENYEKQLENAKIEVEKPFSKEEELKQKLGRLNELNTLLNMNEREEVILDEEPSQDANKSSDKTALKQMRR